MIESSSGSANTDLVPIWLAIGLVFALFVGAGAGVLAWLSGDKVPAAILKGGRRICGNDYGRDFDYWPSPRLSQ